MENIKYFKREKGGIVKLENNLLVYSLDLQGNWVSNQYLLSMFVDGMDDFKIISEDEVNQIIEDRKKTLMMLRRLDNDIY